MVKFSIIIPMRKIGDYVYEAMLYFKKQTYKDFEIIILSEIEENINFEKTKIIKVGKVSPAVKRNIGVEKSRGEIIAFIDDDAYPEESWLENALINFNDNNIVAVGGPSLVPKNATFFQKVSNKVYELSSKKTGDRYRVGKRQEIDDWPTCNFFVRKKYFEEAGGFDSKYWGGEDTQLCYSLLKTGKKIIYDPKCIIYHHPRKKLEQHLKQTYFWGMWRGFFMKKHPKQSIQLVFFLPAMSLFWIVFGFFGVLINDIFKWIYILSLLLYFAFLVVIGIRTKSLKLFIPTLLLSFLTQITYSLGFIKGLFSGEKGPIKQTLNPNEDINIK